MIRVSTCHSEGLRWCKGSAGGGVWSLGHSEEESVEKKSAH